MSIYRSLSLHSNRLQTKMKLVDKLSKKEHEELILDLINAFSQTKNLNDSALFLQDLLTKHEINIIAKRLRIAKLLLTGRTYTEIQKDLHVSHGTVAKIAIWLSERGDGFRKVIEKLPLKADNKKWQDRSEWDSFKRRYSLYFWPELLLEEIVKNANLRQKERIREVLEKLEEKSDLHKRIEKYLKPTKYNTT